MCVYNQFHIGRIFDTFIRFREDRNNIIFDANISLGTVWLIFVIYTWLIISMIQQQFTLQEFLYVLCITGTIVSTSMFIIQGIEELAFPKGAIMFHLDGLVQALSVFSLFTVPLIIYNYSNAQRKPQQKPKQPSLVSEQAPQLEKTSYNEEKWEEATIEDLESGTFEII